MFPLFCFSQDTIEVKKYHDNKKISEVYTISLPDSLKNGDYKRFHKNGNPWVTGFYKNNTRKGIWNFYETLKPPFDCTYKYDYTSDEILYRKNENRHPDFIGGDSEYYYIWKDFIRKNIKQLKKLKGKDRLSVIFRISTSGIPDSIVFLPDSIHLESTLFAPKERFSEYASTMYSLYFEKNSKTIEILKTEIYDMPIWFRYKTPKEKETWVTYKINFK